MPPIAGTALSRLYLTTPIYYVNSVPHVGHAHTTIMADVMKRMALMRGTDVFLTTGTDEHGQKNYEAARDSGLSTIDYLDRQSRLFQNLFDALGVGYDMYVRTTRSYHMEQVQEVERRLKDKGMLTQKPYRGLYCVGCEQFKKKTDLDEQGRCVDHLTVPEEMDEVNWFFKIEPYREWLVGYIESHPDWIQPEQFKNDVLDMLRAPLEDMCISRPKSRVKLGVEMPFDPNYVTYVWFDALINYITNIKWPDKGYQEWWPYAEHLIGKDIVKTHCIFWPIMLKALEIEPPLRFWVHGYWVAAGGQKMSKSLGNGVDPFQVINLAGADALRYYLAKNMRKGGDSQISLPMVVSTYNADLANKIGNLLSRVVKFTARHFEGKVPDVANVLHADDLKLARATAETAAGEYRETSLNNIPSLVQSAMRIAESLNLYVDTSAPWTLIKDPNNRGRVASILYALMDSTRLLLEMLYPVIPTTSKRGLEVLGGSAISSQPLVHHFAALRLKGGAVLGQDTNLFPRVEVGEAKVA